LVVCARFSEDVKAVDVFGTGAGVELSSSLLQDAAKRAVVTRSRLVGVRRAPPEEPLELGEVIGSIGKGGMETRGGFARANDAAKEL